MSFLACCKWAMIAYLLEAASLVMAMTAPGPTMPNIAPNCNKWHIVVAGDSCGSVAKVGGISTSKFYDLNPDVTRDCGQYFWLDYAYCIGVDASLPSTRPASTSMTSTSKPLSTTSKSSSAVIGTSSASIISTSGSKTSPMSSSSSIPYSTRWPVTSWNITKPSVTASFPPKETQRGQPTYCIDWHFVIADDDTCQKIVNRYSSSLTMDNLLDWNPELLDDCSGLLINHWLCIRIQPQASLTLTFNTGGQLTVPNATSYTPPTTSVRDPSFTPKPSQGAFPSACKAFYKAKPNDRCDNVLEDFSLITREQFFTWNPFLDGDSLPSVPVATEKPYLTESGEAKDCSAWFGTKGSETCEMIASFFEQLTESDFKTWNPSVRSDCSGIKANTNYCVAVGKVSGTSTPTATSTKAGGVTTSTPSPVQDGMIKGCQRFYYVQSGDGCWAITNSAKIEWSDFYKWNPGVEKDCTNLQAETYVCIGISGSSTTITKGPPIPT